MMYLGTPRAAPWAASSPGWRADRLTVPDSALHGSGLQHVYELLLEPFDPGFEPLVVCFLQQAREVLDAWNGDASVELRATVAGAVPSRSSWPHEAGTLACPLGDAPRVRDWLERTLPCLPRESNALPANRHGRHGAPAAALPGRPESPARSAGHRLQRRQVEELIRPYVFLLDELVLRRLCQAEQPLWPLMQQRLFGQDSGGDHFFDLSESRLTHTETQPIDFEVLCFCLAAGFHGRLSDNAAKLHEYKERLKARIPRPLPPGATEAAPPAELMPIYELPLRYYLVAGLAVVLLPVVLWWVSNT